MRNFKKTALYAISLAATVLLSVNAMAENYSTTVRLNGIATHTSETVDFKEFAPTQINNRTYVHTRGFAEAAGMKVGWDQENKTAFLKVFADKTSAKPFEVYTHELFDKLEPLGTPSNITVSLMMDNQDALLRFNYDIGNGNVAGYAKTVTMDGAATMVDDKALMIPLRNIMELLGLTVDWSQETMTVDVSLPQEAKTTEGLEISDNWLPPYVAPAVPEEEFYTGDTPPNYIPDGVHEIGEYLGNFKITKYCPCNTCNGGWGPYTAWAGGIIPGQTIGVNPNVIPKLAWVYIDGLGWRRAEDTGGGIGTLHIDVAVSNHHEATSGGIIYRDVWIAK